MKIYNNLTELVGNTPMLKLERYCRFNKLNAQIIAKLECFNPLSSIKDRVALAMIDKAEETGTLKPGAVIIEPTSGNTGIGIVFAGACRDYRVILTMPDTMSKERIKILKALGAEIVLTEGKLGMTGAINRAKELLNEIEGSFMPLQFENLANPEIHEKTTALEIIRDTDANIDVFVAGVGTGGTLSGVVRTLKKRLKNVKVVAVEPKDSPVLSGGEAGPHALQGIGAGFIPKTYDSTVADEIITIEKEEAYQACRDVAKMEGLLIGISSGAALCAAKKLAEQDENKGKNIVVIFPDSGERYLSTDLY